jgi:hypothetical protein
MPVTGWIGDSEPETAPRMPLTELLLARKERRAGPLETALARSRAEDLVQARDEAAAAPGPDERASGLVARGYLPGQISQLSMRLADTEAEIATEEDKIERAARRAERMHREHEAGRIGAFDIMRALGDSDEGDQATVDRLRRRADSLRRQIAEAQEAISPPQARPLDGVESASRHAHDVFVEVTRQRMAAAQDGRVVRPFGSRGGAAVRSEVTCEDCIAIGATPEQSWMIHADPDAPAGVALPEAELAESGGREAGRGERWPATYDDMGREITRAVGYNDLGEYGNHPVACR